MKSFFRQIGIHNVIVCTIVLLYTLLCIACIGRSILCGDIEIISILNRDSSSKIFDDYGQRGKIIYRKVDNYYTKLLSGEISSTQVIFGEENWLFYKGEKTSIDDFEGTNAYSELEMGKMLNASLNVQNILSERGIQFTLFIPPNKERVYHEYMPNDYKYGGMSRTDKLIAYLSDNGVNALGCFAELNEAKREYPLYFKYDTHWNQLGAYIGTKCVLQSWGIDIPALDDQIIVEKPLYKNYRESAMDDLAGMLGMKERYVDDIEFLVSSNMEVDLEKVNYVENPNAICDAVLLLIGDSFRVSMVPTLATYFSRVYIVHRDSYSKDMIEDFKPNYLIAEYVERYSDSIESIESIIQ